jgi:hypothetical protein
MEVAMPVKDPDIGEEEKRKIVVEPTVDPVPRETPLVPDEPAPVREPVEEPERVKQL